MKLISHRGNISGRIPSEENKPRYIDDAIEWGYDVEIDVRCSNGYLFLGHDTPDYQIDLDWLINRLDQLWIHTKDFQSLCNLIDTELRIFYHEKEQHTIIHRTNLVWSHNLIEANTKSVVPMLSKEDVETHLHLVNKVYGVCSDHVDLIK